jgi:hypothetical protein
MKKALAMGDAALLAFALVFIDCNDAYELTTTETEEIPSLPGPINLKAVNTEQGVITLAWDPGYEVYRKTVDGHQVKLAPLNNQPIR